MTLERLNALPPEAAANLFRDCCGSSRWVAVMVAGRPYASAAEVLEAADAAWASTGPEDWDEAIAHHPRIGDQKARRDVSGQASAWSAGEQAAAAASEEAARRDLANVMAEYERQFGRIYLVCAAGLTAGDMVADARARLANDAEVERRRAAEEQGKITGLRLARLLGPGA